jgi:glycosyltransferase involved in cell wall biosynthesis
MRFGIFVVMAGRQAGGPETYEHQLIRALVKLDAPHEYHIFCLHRDAAASFQLTRENLKYHVLRPGVRWLSIPFSLPLSTWRAGVDLLHATFIPPPLPSQDYVFTMHDIGMFTHPEFYHPSHLRRLRKPILEGLKKARLILCVSGETRDLVAERFGVPDERLTVVYNGVDDRFRPAPPAQVRSLLDTAYQLRHPYILFVGQLKVVSKNLIRLLEAFSIFRREVKSDLKLVLAGRRPTYERGSTESIDAALDRLGLRDEVFELGHVTDQDLPLLYSGAEMFLFPSLLEGFGLPVIEAMACGTPVITSNISCMPEVAGGAALLINPHSAQDIAEGIHRLASDSALRDSLRSKGLSRAGDFSWHRTAEQTLAAYQRSVSLK